MVAMPISPIEDYEVPVSFWLRPMRAAPNTLKYWWEDASCYDLPPELFDFALKEGVSPPRQETIEENEAKFEQARKACSSCPVWHLCYQKASGDDFFYTMRAGIEPAQFTQYKEAGRVRYRSGQELGDKDTCLRGHNNWKIWGKKRPRRKCVDCGKMSPAEKAAFDAAYGVD